MSQGSDAVGPAMRKVIPLIEEKIKKNKDNPCFVEDLQEILKKAKAIEDAADRGYC